MFQSADKKTRLNVRKASEAVEQTRLRLIGIFFNKSHRLIFLRYIPIKRALPVLIHARLSGLPDHRLTAEIRLLTSVIRPLKIEYR